MKCPFCKGEKTQVVDTRESEDGDTIRRRRRCLSCDKRFTTYEMVELRMPQVVKQNGMRSEFDEEKLRTSFKRALHKRPVSAELVDAAIDNVTQKLHALGEREPISRSPRAWSFCVTLSIAASTSSAETGRLCSARLKLVRNFSSSNSLRIPFCLTTCGMRNSTIS